MRILLTSDEAQVGNAVVMPNPIDVVDVEVGVDLAMLNYPYEAVHRELASAVSANRSGKVTTRLLRANTSVTSATND